MEPPPKPSPSDCCNSGCNPCILDVYEEQLKKYQNNQQLAQQPRKNCVKLTIYAVFFLTKRKKHTEQTDLLTFKAKDAREDEIVDFNPGQYFLLKNVDCTKPYTPIFKNGTEFTILVKYYNGKMTNYLKNLEVGDETLWRGPYGTPPTKYSKYLLCIAQGVGIAPIFAKIQGILNDENCETFVKLFFCCTNCREILLRDFLYDFLQFWNFSYEVFLSDSKDLVKKYKEVIHSEKLDCSHLENYLFDKKNVSTIFVCGSDNFMFDIKYKLNILRMDSENIILF